MKNIIIIIITFIICYVYYIYRYNFVYDHSLYNHHNLYNKIQNYNNNIENNLTVVSGFWNVKSKYNFDRYNKWFSNSLKINQKYIFYCDKFINDYIKQFRNGYETQFIDYSLDNFYSKKFIKDDCINNFHVPSKELGMIWNEKIHLLKLAKDNDPNPTQYYIWIDSGITPYRNKMPSQKKLNVNIKLPKKKLYYSSVYDFYHSFSGGVLLIDRDIIDEFHEKYYNLLSSCNDGWKCGSDQIIFTRMMKLYPELFYQMSNGYGGNLIDLFRGL